MSGPERAPFFPQCPVCGTNEHSPVAVFEELVFARCAGCGLIYKREQVPGLGRGYEDDYFLAGRRKYFRRWKHRVRKCRRQIQACLAFAPGARSLLDVGCSAGYALAAAKSLGLDPVGLDYSGYAARSCRERGFHALQGALERLPFPPRSFDIVLLKAVLEHIPSPMDGLREAARVLRPGGVIFVIVPDGDYFKHALVPRTGRDFRPDARGWQHHVYFHSGSFRRACGAVGLKVAYEGRAVVRPRAGGGLPPPFEHLRWAGLAAWTATARATRLRRDIQAFVAPAGAAPVTREDLRPPSGA